MAPGSHRIFISHSHLDNDFSTRLAQDLQRVLVDEDAIFYDALLWGLQGGDSWWRRILQELESRNIFIVILSPDAMSSNWVNDEIDIAWRKKNSPMKMRILPLLYQECEVRTDLKGLQIISFLAPEPYETAFQRVLRALDLPSEPPAAQQDKANKHNKPADPTTTLIQQMETALVEQLWYTWSDVGLSTIRAGFRIRAASPGLTEISSERVKSMDRHMRYALPPGTDRVAITSEMAPVCLAFTRTDWKNEYILVHKNYTGKDGVGRQENFFIHLVALGEFSHSFTAEDAIWLWDSVLWDTNDERIDRRSNKLEEVPLKTLQGDIGKFHPDFAQVRQSLPFLIEAYLSRKDRSPLYIAAPAHTSAMIAYLIAGLLNCLPSQLVADLTFSTYEPDVTKATTEIVGTSWIATPGKEGEASQVFSPQFYQEKLAVNCYTGEQSVLQGHPQITYNPLAADFAAYTTNCLLTDQVEQLYELLDQAEKRLGLDVHTFLRMYYSEIANTESIPEADIVRDLADPYVLLDQLCKRNFRESIIERAGKNRQWSDNQLQRRLNALREQAQREFAGRTHNKNRDISASQEQSRSSALQGPRKRSKNQAAAHTKKNQLTLAEALTLLAERAIPDIIDAMKKVGAQRETSYGLSGEEALDRQKKIETVAALLSLMDCCVLPQYALEVWKQLLDEIATNRNATTCLTTNRELFLWLIEKWDKVFPIDPGYDNTVRPLLIIAWNHLGKFLKLDLRQRHKQWNSIAAERLSKDTTLTPQVALELGQKYAKEIDDLFAQLLQGSELTIAASFAIRLIEKSYPATLHASLIEQLLDQLIHNSQLWSDAKNLVATITRNGYKGAESYLNLVETFIGYLLTSKQANLQADGSELVDLLVAYGYPGKKKLVDLLLNSNTGQANLEKILERVYQTPEELKAFFINHGAHYLSTADQIRAMLSVYQKLLPLPQKMERLFTFLDTRSDGNTITYLLSITPLEKYEPARILERYGNGYLKTFQQTPQLANKVVEWFIQLVKLGYPDRLKLLFILFTSETDYKLLEILLSSAQLTLEESREFFRRYGISPNYFPFFYRSETALAHFAQLARAANTFAGSGQAELAKEKMALVLAWFDPSKSPPKNEQVESILRAASLTAPEQIRFLQLYGETYLSDYPRLPLLNEYIGTYITAFNGDDLDRAETKSFFIFLTRKHKLSFLDIDTHNRIQWWKTIDSYFSSPSISPAILTDLARALYSLGLPNSSTFTVRLAVAFVSCVNNGNDLDAIMKQMQPVPKIHNNLVQFLYIVAEQGAEQYRQQQREIILLPYLSFVLGNTQEPFVQSNIQEGQKHFRQIFLDTLLHNINVLDLNKWKMLDTLLTQNRFSRADLEQWQDYLKGLDLLDRLQSAEAVENRGSAQEAQSQLPPADISKSLSWFARTKYYWRVYRPAKGKLKKAMKSRKVDLIAEAWIKYGNIINKFHPGYLTQDQGEQITASYELVDYCEGAAKYSTIPLDLAQKIVTINSTIEKFHLHPSPEQNVCIERARMQVQSEGTQQPYQNPSHISSGSLPAGQVPTRPIGTQNMSPWKHDRPIILGTPPDNMSGQPSRPPQSSTRFELDEGRRSKKKED